ncbi:hypothetical protein HQ585_13750 [candidate division KSB1 bacterium]|nr:hypothetical protein [candidate division KSB1 bacterium]
MTTRQRLLAASKQQPVDIIPVSPRLGYAAHYHCGSASPQNILRLKKTYDFDPFITLDGQDLPLVSPFGTFRFADGVEVEIKVTDLGPKRSVDRTIHTPEGDLHEIQIVPNPGRTQYGMAPDPVHTEYIVKTRDDLPKLKYLMPPVNISFADEYHGWEHVAGHEAVTRLCVYGPIGYQADMVMSHEDLMINYLVDREFIIQLVDLFFQNLQAQTKALLEHGVRYFHSSWYAHSLSVGWSPEMFREWFLPMIRDHVKLIHNYDGIVDYYDDGKNMGILEMLLEADVDVLETCTPPPVGDMNLEKAKEICSGNITLMGYTDLIYVIHRGSVEDIRKTVEQACYIGGKDGSFILGTSDSMREGTPVENIDAYFKYARHFGK